jgi:nucleoside 2-deoxyribosyltransferase
MIYLASPYTHLDSAVRQNRFEAVCHATAALIRQGEVVYSPIVHGHPLCQYGLPIDWAFWEEYDLAFLEKCDRIVVLKLDGWQESVGVQAEIEAARQLGKPIAFFNARDVTEENPGQCRG